MKVFIITHGTHKKGGNDATSYDGPLTQEAKDKVAKISLPKVDAIYRGIMQRHRETAEVLGVEEKLTTHPACGNDQEMFACINQNDMTVVREFQKFLTLAKEYRHKAILVITSRLFPIIFKYLQSGGEAKLGPLGPFCTAVETIATWENTNIPVMESGIMHEFEF